MIMPRACRTFLGNLRLIWCFGLAVVLLAWPMPLRAVREATANANLLIRNFERQGEFGRAAVWQEVASQAFDLVSVPVTQTVLDYCERNGKTEQARQLRADIELMKQQRDEYARRARANWARSKDSQEAVDAERARTAEYLAIWVAHYPSAFYQFGFYNNLFRRDIVRLKEDHHHAAALSVEAAAAELCARQFEEVVVPYFQRQAGQADAARKTVLERMIQDYAAVATAQRERAQRLRTLAAQNPDRWPAEADRKELRVPQFERRLKQDEVIQIARADRRVQDAIARHPGARPFVTHLGAWWTVGYHPHVAAFVDDRTGKVTGVLLAPGNLEDHTPGGR
jgi:hypothetical protein